MQVAIGDGIISMASITLSVPMFLELYLSIVLILS